MQPLSPIALIITSWSKLRDVLPWHLRVIQCCIELGLVGHGDDIQIKSKEMKQNQEKSSKIYKITKYSNVRPNLPQGPDLQIQQERLP